MSSEAQENSVKRVFRNPKNRQTKVHLIFDEKARKYVGLITHSLLFIKPSF